MPFRSHHTLRFGDVDSAGIVYYPRYLHYCHVAMEEFFAGALGVPYPRLLAEQRLGFPAVRAEVDFRRPLHYGDAIEIEVAIENVGASSLTFRFTFFKRGEDEPVAGARVVTVCLDLERFEKRPVPAWVRGGEEAT